MVGRKEEKAEKRERVEVQRKNKEIRGDKEIQDL